MLLASPALADDVTLPGPGGVALKAKLFRAEKPTGPSVIALHGCGGPYPKRDEQWAQVLTEQGHTVLFPDSFGSRGLGSQCTVKNRTVTVSGLRRDDAIAAAKWLAAQDFTPAGGVALMGWSNGASVVLSAGRAAPDLPPNLFRALVAFYPGCSTPLKNADWKPAAPLLILIGEDDDWTPAAPCEALAGRTPSLVHLVTYPGAFHDFDVPDTPVRERTGLAFTAHNNGIAHAGTNPAARDDALIRVTAFLEAMPVRE